MTAYDWLQSAVISCIGAGAVFGIMHMTNFMTLPDHLLIWMVALPLATGFITGFVLWYRSLPSE